MDWKLMIYIISIIIILSGMIFLFAFLRSVKNYKRIK